VQDLALTAGVSYSKDSLFTNKRYRLSFGATYGFASDLNTRVRYEFYRNSPTTGPMDSDTLTSVKGSTYVPQVFTVGASIGYGVRWNVGTEFTYQDWSKFKSLSQPEGTLGAAWKAALGGEITPDLLSTNYLKRVTYRVGLSYEQTPYQVDMNDDPGITDYHKVKDLGINFGFSLPAGQSSLDLAFRYGKRGNKTDTFLAEDYFRIYFGITFNDRWFIKRKFD
jgi:long-subunit fatty acid transport protein